MLTHHYHYYPSLCNDAMVFDPGREWGEGRSKEKGTVTSAGPEAGSKLGWKDGVKWGGGDTINQSLYLSQFKKCWFLTFLPDKVDSLRVSVCVYLIFVNVGWYVKYQICIFTYFTTVSLFVLLWIMNLMSPSSSADNQHHGNPGIQRSKRNKPA